MKRFLLFFVLITMIFTLAVPTYVFAEEISDSSDNVMSSITPSGADKVFSTITIVVMSIGILGLPAYFWLNSRKKRLLAEYEEKRLLNDGDSDDEIENN